MSSHNRSLFASLAWTVALTLVLYEIIAVMVIAYYMLVPVGRRAAEDLATNMVFIGQTWIHLPAETRPEFETRMFNDHGLRVKKPDVPLQLSGSSLPYLYFLRKALSKQMHQVVKVMTTIGEPDQFWIDMPIDSQTVRIGFNRERIPVHPFTAAALVVISAALLAALTAMLAARRISRPVTRLSRAAVEIGRGAAPHMLPESGPRELADLISTFNAMAKEVKELLENRATLLAGISHDLRSPLTRMRMAVELLPEEIDAKIKARFTRDINTMNLMIQSFLEFSKGLEEEKKDSVDIQQLIVEAIKDVRVGLKESQIKLHRGKPCVRRLQPLALRRIITNLIENAVRYGGDNVVDVTCECGSAETRVSILDRGPGIPAGEREAVFRPFYRLEGSRSRKSGGSGLGLAIVRQLTRIRGWQVSLLEREGGGTEARVQLPL